MSRSKAIGRVDSGSIGGVRKYIAQNESQVAFVKASGIGNKQIPHLTTQLACSDLGRERQPLCRQNISNPAVQFELIWTKRG